MDSKSKKIMISIDENKYPSWEIYLKNEFKKINSTNVEIICNNIDLSCTKILEIIEIANQYNCRIISFHSTSSKTIVSSQSLGYRTQFIIDNYSNENVCINNENITFPKTNCHQGTVRSGEYIESAGDLLILGDVNPGAKVSAEGNIIIWGRLLGIAHAGSKGNSDATISALQLRPLQIRIGKKIARGPKEKPQIGLAEQARIDSDEIIILPLDTNKL